jgi:COMPASS component SWD3
MYIYIYMYIYIRIIIFLYNYQGKSIVTLLGHSSYVYCLSANPQNRSVFSGGYDGTVMVFDVTSGSCLTEFNAHSEAISSVEYRYIIIVTYNIILSSCIRIVQILQY